ncbi:hypothetical protein LZD49_06455 [Dyadobacter sp. CY261]|uniref:hypothetical protein n=1 Tax=Dyadobacter sp. CY261 TaxID=2907203 RepID=UPI001F2F9A05|nr:hypothetical protein [Dyadobacter sp. CY261]MCF0070106.1 hypothetical protein [Dyadobacter sp. CY261]
MKQLSLRHCGMLTFVFLCCIGCTDHVIPPDPEVETTITTLETQLNYKPENFYIFGARLEVVGSKSIKEIGIVYSLRFLNNPSFHAIPTLADTKVVSETNPGQIDNYRTGRNLPVSSFEKMYYRAFAILEDDTVVYGNVLEYIWYDTAVIEAESPVFLNGFLFGKMNVTDLGGLPIAEYGIVYSYINNDGETLADFPTLADNKLTFDLPVSLGFHSKVIPIAKPKRMNARSYVKYQNGVIEYGKSLAGASF